MKIAFNLRLVRKKSFSGIGFFSIQTALRISKLHPEHTFYFIFDQPVDTGLSFAENVIPVVVSPKSRSRNILLWIWYEILLTRKLKKINPDLFIGMDSLMSLSSDIPSLLVIHDLNFVHYPHFMPKSIGQFYRKYSPLYVKKAIRMAAVSEYTKKDLIETYGVAQEKIDVVYSASNVCFTPVSENEQEKIRKQYTHGNSYFLLVGSIHPRKNVVNQLLAFDIFRQIHPEYTHQFVIVGDCWMWGKQEKILLKK